MRKLVFLFYFLSNCLWMIAQTSEFFGIETHKNYVELIPKNLSKVETGVAQMPNCDFDLFTNEVTIPIIKDVFSELSDEKKEILKYVKFNFFFDKSSKIVYYRFIVRSKHLTEVLTLEKELHALSQKFLNRDISSYFKIEDDKFVGLEICTGQSLYGVFQ